MENTKSEAQKTETHKAESQKAETQSAAERKPETYTEMKARHTRELNDFPMFFAFSNKQFDEGMLKFGLPPDETDKILSFGSGGYILKEDGPKLTELFKRQSEELKLARRYKGFAVNAFVYELANHEYCITRDPTDTLRALGLTENDLAADKKLNGMFTKAVKLYLADCAAAEREAEKPSKQDKSRKQEKLSKTSPSFTDKFTKHQEKVDAYKETRQANPPDIGKDHKKSGDALE